MKKTTLPRNILFVTEDSLITDVAWQCKNEGHKVKYYIGNKSEADIGDGFIDKVDNWEKELDWSDVVIFDDVLGQGKKAQELREQGYKVVGGTEYTDMLEDDRSFGQRELKRHKVKIIPFWEFDMFDDAIDFVIKNPKQYVVKPSGEAQNIKRLLFVGEEKDGSDVVRILKAYREVWSDEVKEFQLQERVNGVEIAVTAFFNGEKFIDYVNINFEHKKLFPGNFGPATGEMGTTMFWTKQSQLFDKTLKRMEPTLKKEGYVGSIDLNCIVNSTGIYPLEFTSRFGYPAISIQSEGMNSSIGDFLYNIADGKGDDIKVKKGFQIGIRILVPPYPFKDQKTFDSYSKDATVTFKNPKKTEGIHIEDIKIKEGQWVVTGSSGVAVVACGTGLTMREAQKQAYGRIDNVLIPNMYYRDDIGDRWYDEFDKLYSWGHLN